MTNFQIVTQSPQNLIVERIAVDVDDWPDTPAPILLVTIGGKATK